MKQKKLEMISPGLSKILGAIDKINQLSTASFSL